MTDDAIKAALHKAAEVISRLDERKKGAATSWEEFAAAAVAAFLRSPDINTELMPSGADEIADAVERAARETGE